MAISVIGFDTAKHVFQVHGADTNGRTVLRKRLRRNQVTDFFCGLPPCVVGMEATRGTHHSDELMAFRDAKQDRAFFCFLVGSCENLLHACAVRDYSLLRV